MKLLTAKAKVKCSHRGSVSIDPSQTLVTIDNELVLVEPDPVGRSIWWCPNTSAVTKACKTTKKPKTGYSRFISIWNAGSWKAVCLDNLLGETDGLPPVESLYVVHDPGQEWIDEG